MTGPASRPQLGPDYREFLSALIDAGVEFLVIGGFALARHGFVRATVDLDVFVNPSAENAARVALALAQFGAPLADHGVDARHFEGPGAFYQVGVAPNRIDILTSIEGVTFAEALVGSVVSTIDGREVGFIGRTALLRNKRATGRPQDLADVTALERLGG